VFKNTYKEVHNFEEFIALYKFKEYNQSTSPKKLLKPLLLNIFITITLLCGLLYNFGVLLMIERSQDISLVSNGISALLFFVILIIYIILIENYNDNQIHEFRRKNFEKYFETSNVDNEDIRFLCKQAIMANCLPHELQLYIKNSLIIKKQRSLEDKDKNFILEQELSW